MAPRFCVVCHVKQCNFNMPGLPANFCNGCKPNGAINVVSKLCIICKITHATSNYKGKKPLYCSKCSLETMINVTHKKCINCRVFYPYFNVNGSTEALYCKKCSDPTMIRISSKLCVICRETMASCNIPPDTTASVCASCKVDGSINVSSRKCITCNVKIASFNYATEKIGMYCFAHKLDNMICVKTRLCITCNIKTPNFNVPSEKTPLFCGDCRKKDHINVKKKKCIECGLKGASYNLPEKSKSLFCRACAKPGMVSKKKAIMCKEDCGQQRQGGFDGFCKRCCYFYHPERAPKWVKFRELEVDNYLRETFKDLNIIYNKRLKGDGICTSDSPDWLIHFNLFSVIVECDENQHKSYDKNCIKTRIHRMHEALNRDIVVIKFNPDCYRDSNNNLIFSCFSKEPKTGITRILKKNEAQWNMRLKTLKETFEKYMDYDAEAAPIRVVELFYDAIKEDAEYEAGGGPASSADARRRKTTLKGI